MRPAALVCDNGPVREFVTGSRAKLIRHSPVGGVHRASLQMPTEIHDSAYA